MDSLSGRFLSSQDWDESQTLEIWRGQGEVGGRERMRDQKATIIFQTVGVKRLKVCYAQLEILE